MGERMKRLASSFGPPWVSESEMLPDEQVLGRFTGLWTIVYVTANWVIIRSPTRDFALRLAEVKTVEAGLDPSPHDSGGPMWGIWITMTYGKEHGAQIGRPGEAAALIHSLRPAARRRREDASRSPAPPDPDAGWRRT
jgi:hypothetical protein